MKRKLVLAETRFLCDRILDSALAGVVESTQQWGATLLKGHVANFVYLLSYVRERGMFANASADEVGYIEALATHNTPWSKAAGLSMARDHARDAQMKRLVERTVLALGNIGEVIVGKRVIVEGEFPAMQLISEFHKKWSKMVMGTKGFLCDQFEGSLYTSGRFLSCFFEGL